jgi:hypothetical protein
MIFKLYLIRLRLSDIKEQALKFVFQKKTKQVIDELERIKVSLDPKAYEHTLTLIFWFAIHLENL